MTLFEYLSVAVSIVLSLSVVRLVGGLQAAFDPARRYWIHWGWVVAKVVSCLLFWWNFWLYREGVAWNFGYFLFAFLGPIILYVQAAALVPANPSGVRSWRDQFFEVHRLFYLANALLLVHLGVAPPLLLSDVPVAVGPGAVVTSVAIAISVIGALSKSERVQAIVAPMMFAILAFSVSTFLFRPPSA